MREQQVAERAAEFIEYAQKRHAWSLSATFQHWMRQQGLSVLDRQQVWHEVKKLTGTDEE